MRRSNIIYHIINAVIFIALELTALTMLSNNSELQNSWFSNGSQTFMKNIWGFSQNVSQYFSLKKRNEELALDNHGLRVRIAQLEAALADSHASGIPQQQSKDLAGNFRYIPATIAKISNNTHHNYMILDKGTADGVVKGSGVITGKGVIGVIDAVSEHHSYARSFKNHEMSISSRLGKEGFIGPMSWDGRSSSRAILREIPHHAEVAPGDTVYTSGFSTIFPADIPIGTTGEAEIVNGSTYEIEVMLFEDFGKLKYVTIVKNTGQDEIEKLEETI